MRTHELIRKAREQLGLSHKQVAERSGLTPATYRDVEQHADDVFTAIELANVRRMCATLGLDIEMLVSDPALKPFALSTDAIPDCGEARHVLIKRYRESRNVSVAEVADAIGFDEEAVRRAEMSDDYLETLPIAVLNKWAQYIRLPLTKML